MGKRKCMPLCVVCGRRLSRLVKSCLGYFPSQLQAVMYASQLELEEGQTTGTTTFDDGYTYLYLHGRGWKGLNKVCSSGDCLRKLVQRVPVQMESK